MEREADLELKQPDKQMYFANMRKQKWRDRAAVLANGKRKIAIFTGNSHPGLANEIATYLRTRLGRCITSASDDEHFVFFA